MPRNASKESSGRERRLREGYILQYVDRILEFPSISRRATHARLIFLAKVE